jgi:hypothetical protein
MISSQNQRLISVYCYKIQPTSTSTTHQDVAQMFAATRALQRVRSENSAINFQQCEKLRNEILTSRGWLGKRSWKCADAVSIPSDSRYTEVLRVMFPKSSVGITYHGMTAPLSCFPICSESGMALLDDGDKSRGWSTSGAHVS